jgi:hypothetical protein
MERQDGDKFKDAYSRVGFLVMIHEDDGGLKYKMIIQRYSDDTYLDEDHKL